eukprot:CAMPEP_0180153868 /NCGR_PEP_ID=MMETSP0986-20121125/23804_1 /TAXON_ID=697907 /ORGANISM="non described non described, Strain CCMP2293" /LENGTH=99 /DNA_ID=CAMNT_0022102083 /DNA_START=385 /DNA_END=682 /DNA_ORIENTATION=+
MEKQVRERCPPAYLQALTHLPAREVLPESAAGAFAASSVSRSCNRARPRLRGRSELNARPHHARLMLSKRSVAHARAATASCGGRGDAALKKWKPSESI